MSALFYLLKTRIKNRLLSMLKNPGSLLGLLVMAALLGVSIMGGVKGNPERLYRDPAELHAAVLLLYAAIFILVAKNGLGKGASLFSMEDVNLLFTAPVSGRRILLYGLFQQLGTSLLMGMFLLFQYSWMRNVYGASFGFVVSVMLGYALTVFCAQLTAMAIYTYASGNDRRKRGMTAVLVGIPAIAVLYVLWRGYLGRETLLPSLVAAANGLPVSLFPVAGWLREMVLSLSAGSLVMALTMFLSVGAYIALLTFLLTALQSDYYEDVLQATEIAHSAIVAAKEGKVRETLPANVKVGKTGLRKGLGAGVFFVKHRLEARRARRFILDPISLIMLAVVVAFTFFMRGTGLLGIFLFSVYMQFFTVSTGRWMRELTLPYIYMVPEKPYVKLLACLGESIVQIAVEAAVAALAIGAIMGLSALEIFALAFSRLTFGVLFTAGFLLTDRLFAGLTIKWLVYVVLFVVLILLVVPGIALGVWVLSAFPGILPENLGMLLLPAAANVPVALAALFASRNMLTHAEMAGGK